MKAIETGLPGVILIEPPVFGDHRGFFMESFHKTKFADMGITVEFVQDNHSKSSKGVLRGLHYQVQNAQDKLCRVVRGEVLDVAVDIRKGSPTFGKWISAVLSEENKREIFVPKGFAHGFLVLSETADFLYKCSDFYSPEHERGVLWNDPAIGIDWGFGGEPLISGKDAANPLLAEIPEEDLPAFDG